APRTVDTLTGAALVVVTARITDDLAGVVSGNVSFTGPISGVSSGNPHLVSGTVLDGVWEFDITVPQYSAPGTWVLDPFTLNDGANNNRLYHVADLQQLGFPTNCDQTRAGHASFPTRRSSDLAPRTVDTLTGAALVVVTA